MRMSKTMFEVNWHHVNDMFSHCSVTPIKVIREGVLPGCAGVSITAIDSKGNKFQSSPDDYFGTEAEAWASVKKGLAESVNAYEDQIAKLTHEVATMRDYLATMPPNAGGNQGD